MKKNRIIIVSIIVVVVLAGAAFMAVRMFAGGAGLDQTMGSLLMSLGGQDTGQASKPAQKVEVEPAPELPKQKNQTYGVISTVKDNTLIIQSGERIYLDEDSDGVVHPSTDGPSVEVVLSGKTKIYHETTYDDTAYDTHEPANGKIRQTVETMDANAIEKNDIATVWGSQRGDRLVADVILINRSLRMKIGGEK
jgi:hypothetical protein